MSWGDGGGTRGDVHGGADRFFVGCNNDGEQDPSYLEAPSCDSVPDGIVALTMAGAGFENRAVILNVRGYDLSRAP